MIKPTKEEIRMKWRVWNITFLIIAVTVVAYFLYHAFTPDDLVMDEVPIVAESKLSNDSISIVDSVYSCIFELRIEHPDIVMAQCIEESGCFTSALFKEGNNCTGMRVPAQRPTLVKGSLYNHARFDSWRECIADYAIWQSIFARGLTRDAYFAYLDRVYAERKGYSERLKNIIKSREL